MWTKDTDTKEATKILKEITKLLKDKYSIRISKKYKNRSGEGGRVYVSITSKK